MEDWTDIRERVASGKVSKRAILRETGMHWKTLKKILTHSEPPGYRLRKARPKQKLGPYQERIEQILKEDQLLPRKQRHTAKRVWERLKEAGFTGGYTVVKEAVQELTQRSQEVFVPLAHPPHFSTGVYSGRKTGGQRRLSVAQERFVQKMITDKTPDPGCLVGS